MNKLTPHRAASGRVATEQASTADLVREALDEAKELVRLEIALAKNEVEAQIAQAKRAAVFFAGAVTATLLCLSMILVAGVIALGGTLSAAVVVALGMLLVAAGLAYGGLVLLPRKVLERTKRRLGRDVEQLKEHLV